MTKEEKVEFILEVTPNLSIIIKYATDEQIDRLYEDAHVRLDYALELA